MIDQGQNSSWGVIFSCIQDTLSSRAALGLPAVQPLGRVRRASKDILHTRFLAGPGVLILAGACDFWSRFGAQSDLLKYEII